MIGRAVAALLLAVALGPAPAAAHGERAQEPFLRTRTLYWYDVKWSATRINVNDELTITGRFRVYDDWPANIAEPTTAFLGVGTPGAAFARKASYIDDVPMIQSTGLELGRDYAFRYVLQARIPGRHHAHPMVNVQSAGGLLGPGQWIEVAGRAADFRYPVVTLTGLAIPNLETYGRIVRDGGRGEVTVAHLPPGRHPTGSVAIEHTFDAPGTYVGLVTVTAAEPITARFRVTVGATDWTTYYLIATAVGAGIALYVYAERKRAATAAAAGSSSVGVPETGGTG